MATPYALSLYQGQAKSIQATIQQDGAAYDVTGLTGSQLTYRAGVRGNESMIEKTITSGITLTSPVSGVVTIALDSADTEVVAGAYQHELWIADGTLDEPVFVGTLTILDSLHHED